MIVALLALVVALGSTATAATDVIIKNSKHVKDGSLGVSDLSAAARRELRGQTGAQGPAGAAGAPGANGAQGPQGQPGPVAAIASGFASNNPNNLLTDEEQTGVLSLDSGPSHSGAVTVSSNARLIAQATAVFAPAGPFAAASTVTCQLSWTTPGAPVTAFGGVGVGRVAPNEALPTVPVVGAVDVTPGTYDVRVLCRPAGDSVRYLTGAVTVVAAPR